jgi:aspartyl/asparaginyl beta-hydroxylase (cupin superfamily)
MDDEVRQSLKSVLAQNDGWQKSLNRIVQSSRVSGPYRLEVIAQLVSLEDSGPGLSYLAMAHAMWMEQTQQLTSALNSWKRASRNHGGMLDAQAMGILGFGDEQLFRTMASKMRDLRSNYLKQSLRNSSNHYDLNDYFRISRALSGYLGEANVFSSYATQQPKVIYIPGLETGGFLDSQSHPIVPALKSAFRDIQAEFDEVMSDQQVLKPFMGHAGKDDLKKYVSGHKKASWDAFFFYRHGTRFDAAQQRCPRTAKVLESIDLCRIDAQSPEICFSVLQPGSRIEPHFGVTNARVVVHLPLRVPNGCYLELTDLGRHFWKEGEPMVFDDTFQHSAYNPSDKPRGILLMDAWHPNLSLVERDMFTKLIKAISAIERDQFLPAEHENV